MLAKNRVENITETKVFVKIAEPPLSKELRGTFFPG